MTETKTAEIGVGSIFYTSWGYDQTNVDFYLVTEVSKTGKTLKLEQVCGAVATIDGRRGVIPWWDAETGTYPRYNPCSIKVYTKRLLTSGYDGQPYLNWKSYANAYLWEGTPEFDTTALGYTGH